MKHIVRGLGFLVLLLNRVVAAQTTLDAQDYDLYAGDFDGDGLTDILYIAKNPTMPSGIARSDGTKPDIAWQSWPSNYLGISWSGNAYNVIVADFNGDGKADIFLQSVVPGNSFLLLTSATGQVVGISQTIPESLMGLLWSGADHHIVAGAFAGNVGGRPKADLFLQATSSSGANAVVLSDANGKFTSSEPAQTWSDDYLGFRWSTLEANIYAGDFNADGIADLLIQAKPVFVMVDGDVPFPVPTYPPNMNGVVLAQAGSPIFAATGVQAWSRMSNGVDWSPLTNNVLVLSSPFGASSVVLQARRSGAISYELSGNASGAIFPPTASALSSTVSLSADTYRLIAGDFSGGPTAGVFYQALTPAGTNAITDAVTSNMDATSALSQPPATGSGSTLACTP